MNDSVGCIPSGEVAYVAIWWREHSEFHEGYFLKHFLPDALGSRLSVVSKPRILVLEQSGTISEPSTILVEKVRRQPGTLELWDEQLYIKEREFKSGILEINHLLIFWKNKSESISGPSAPRRPVDLKDMREWESNLYTIIWGNGTQTEFRAHEMWYADGSYVFRWGDDLYVQNMSLSSKHGLFVSPFDRMRAVASAKEVRRILLNQGMTSGQLAKIAADGAAKREREAAERAKKAREELETEQKKKEEAEREERKRAEDAIRIRDERISGGFCAVCGQPLKLLDRVLKRISHKDCS